MATQAESAEAFAWRVATAVQSVEDIELQIEARDRAIRQQACEEACALICPRCRRGEPREPRNHAHIGADTYFTCEARAIRAHFAQEPEG